MTVFSGVFRIYYLQEKPQLLFQSIVFFLSVLTVANYERCKQDRNQIPNYSGLIQNRVAIVLKKKKKKAKLATYCKAVLESKPKTILKGGFLEFDGEYLSQAAKSVSLNNVTLASVEQDRRLYFNLFHRTLIQI